MHRILTPKRWIRDGLLAIISEVPDRAANLPYERISRALAEDRRLTFVADGDWLYVYRTAAPENWRIDTMLTTLEMFARGIDDPAWPGEGSSGPYVYGPV